METEKTRQSSPTAVYSNNTSPETKASVNSVVGVGPGQLGVIKRNNSIVPYDDNKIAVAMTKAFLAVEGGTAAASSRIHELVATLTKNISETFLRRLPSGGTLHIEDVQDQVELSLMRSGEHKVARAYVLYREEQAKNRLKAIQKKSDYPEISVTLDDGQKAPLDMHWLEGLISEACSQLSDVDSSVLIRDTLRNLYDGVALRDVNKALIMTARTYIEKEPNYSYVAARLLLNELRHEALGFIGLEVCSTHADMRPAYGTAFKAIILKGIEVELLDPKLTDYDLDKLAAAIVPDRDMQFTYLGLQTLYDRYFLHNKDVRFELPQSFFMRVAMGLASNEDDKEARAIEFYNVLSSFDFMSSTPTLFNSATLRPQLSSCYLTTVPDDLTGIYNAMRDNALLSKFAGGLGNDWTSVRALGAHIKGTNGKSQGVVPFLKVANDTAVAVNQGGKRKGAMCAYLETWHLDIEEFLELRKNTGDDRRRTHDMNTANWVPDLFMKRVMTDGEWTLFSPDEASDLHDLFGEAFEKAYIEYEAKAANGEIALYKKIPAVKLWRRMLSMLFETGHPWITFKDVCNVRSPQQHIGVVHSSNLCTEITLNTSLDEIAVCNLGSINLPAHIENGAINREKLARTVKTAMRMLDNVIDINYYSVPQAKNSNLKHRPVGMGVMGFQDALYKLNTPYSSDAAVNFADESMELISYFAIEASNALAEERGTYSSYDGSLWQQGILPIDSIGKLAENRTGGYLEQDLTQRLDWNVLREKVKKTGMRNSNCMAIAPTATISNICGVSQSIEPTYQNLFVKSNLSGEFTVINPYLVEELKQRNLWDDVMVNDLKYYDGSLQKISRIPEEIKAKFATAFEVEPKWLIESASRRQKWIDQAQSLNLYINQPSGKKLDDIYKLAWLKGLKTTYYLRSLAATSTEKSTLADGALNSVSVNQTEPEPKVCLITDPDCEACQ